MSQSNPSSPSDVPVKKPQSRGLFNIKQLRELDEADAVVLAARKPDHAAALAEREITAVMIDFLAQKATETRDLLTDSKAGKGASKSHTALADEARERVIVLLQGVQSAARQKFGARDASINSTYFGAAKLRDSRAILTQATEGILKNLESVALPGITPAVIADIETTFAAYESALDDQGDDAGDATTDYSKAKDALAIVNLKRQEVQFAANGAYPASDHLNREIRKSFKIDPDKNFVG